MPSQLKQIAFRGLVVAEGLTRGIRGGAPSRDPASLRGVRNFVLPLFEPFLGTVIHETTLVEGLRMAVPGARIVAVVDGAALQVVRHHPGLDHAVKMANPQQRFWTAVRDLRRIVRAFHGEPWCALFTSWNLRSQTALAVMMAGGGARVGFGIAPELLHAGIQYDRAQSQVANNLRIGRLLGHDVPEHLEPRVYFSEADLHHAEAMRGPDDSRAAAVLITRTSGGQPTAWPDERFVCVARHLMAQHNCRILLPGTAGDKEALDRLASQMGAGAQSLGGKTSVSQLAALCAISDIAISVDTGGMHVARAQELPMVIIAPAWQDSVEWMPMGKPWARILKGPWFPAPPPPAYAIEEVTVDDVIFAAEELLRLYPPSAASRLHRQQRNLSKAAHLAV